MGWAARMRRCGGGAEGRRKMRFRAEAHCPLGSLDGGVEGVVCVRVLWAGPGALGKLGGRMRLAAAGRSPRAETKLVHLGG